MDLLICYIYLFTYLSIYLLSSSSSSFSPHISSSFSFSLFLLNRSIDIEKKWGGAAAAFWVHHYAIIARDQKRTFLYRRDSEALKQ